jgi:hypothetical protein
MTRSSLILSVSFRGTFSAISSVRVNADVAAPTAPTANPTLAVTSSYVGSG